MELHEAGNWRKSSPISCLHRRQPGLVELIDSLAQDELIAKACFSLYGLHPLESPGRSREAGGWSRFAPISLPTWPEMWNCSA